MSAKEGKYHKKEKNCYLLYLNICMGKYVVKSVSFLLEI